MMKKGTRNDSLGLTLLGGRANEGGHDGRVVRRWAASFHPLVAGRDPVEP